LDIGLEISHVVAGSYNNSDDIVSENEGGKLGKRLLTRTTKSDKKSRSLRHSDNSVDFNDVFDALIEKYKRHRLVFKVILF
jgi:hypothetical protein